MTFFEKLSAAFPRLSVLKEEPMAKHTSFRIGGPATVVLPCDEEELVCVFRFCMEQGQKPLLLGAGTNVLAPDQGLDRVVICTREMTQIQDLGNGIVQAQCGVLLSKLACFARDLSLTGLEFAHGIPGTVGGGVYMNAGAYGGELRHVVTKTRAMLPDGRIVEIYGEEHGFAYRHSVFEDMNAVILSACVQLQTGEQELINAKMQELAQKRRASQPLDMPSAGSTFKRPAGGFAAAMIDEAGLRGKGVGGAAVSEKHAGFVVNLGGATAEDVLATMEMIQQAVKERFGTQLEPEVRIW